MQDGISQIVQGYDVSHLLTVNEQSAHLLRTHLGAPLLSLLLDANAWLITELWYSLSFFSGSLSNCFARFLLFGQPFWDSCLISHGAFLRSSHQLGYSVQTKLLMSIRYFL